MVRMLHAFFEFCYIAHHNIINTTSLAKLEQALDQFHQYRTIFIETDIRQGFNVP
jgi:hypothetical protein